jgi:membrane protease YdiL (CAAX protease family)
MNTFTSLVRRSPLMSFFAFAYALTWGVGALLRGEPTGLLSTNGMFIGAPALAALLVIAATSGRAGFRDLRSRLLRWRVSPRWYAVVLGVPLLIVPIALAVNITVLGGSALDWTKAPPLARVVLFFALFLFVPFTAPLGEEIGWRGFALPRLLTTRSALAASLILAALWAPWHLPTILADPAARPIVPFFLGFPSLAILFTWVFIHTKGSLLVAVLFHAWYDIVLLFPAEMLAAADTERMFWALAAVQGLVAVAVSVLGGLRRPGQVEAELIELRDAPAAAG